MTSIIIFWIVGVFTAIVPYILKWLGCIAVCRLRRKFQLELERRIDIEVKGEGQIYEGYPFKPVGFHLVFDCKALFDDISVDSIDCIFLFRDIPLQAMHWQKGDSWATNLTRPQVPDKLPRLGKHAMTLFFDPMPVFSLWSEVGEVDRQLHSHGVDGTLQALKEAVEFPDSKNDWGIEIKIGLKGKYFGDFIISKTLQKISVKQDWKAICYQVRKIHSELGIRRITEF